MINLTTGPVLPNKQVVNALTSYPISHRSDEYKRLHENFVALMCEKLKVKHVAVLQGSGTLANEAMIWQIKLLGTKGLILTNGEFGDRLIDQSKRIQLDFMEHRVAWGNEIDSDQIEALIAKNNASWLLFAHCETSTGVTNKLERFTEIAQRTKVKLYVDCMSTVGTQNIDLSLVSMATCSSGKGLASIAGIAMVLSNAPFSTEISIPKYFDLSLYDEKRTPFTLSSNLLEALFTAAKSKLNQKSWNRTNHFSNKIFQEFHATGIVPFSRKNSRVFTFVSRNFSSVKFCEELKECGVELSCHSDYLLARNWFQLALFGNHGETEIEEAIQLIAKRLNTIN